VARLVSGRATRPSGRAKLDQLFAGSGNSRNKFWMAKALRKGLVIGSQGLRGSLDCVVWRETSDSGALETRPTMTKSTKLKQVEN